MTKCFAAGALLLCQDPATGSWSTLLQQRSATEHEPSSWSIYGGMAEEGEKQITCMIREVREESGIDVAGLPLWFLHQFDEEGGTFSFYTFAVILPRMAEPVHSSETETARWVQLGDTAETLWANLPTPLHSGLAAFVSQPAVSQRVLRIVESR